MSDGFTLTFSKKEVEIFTAQAERTEILGVRVSAMSKTELMCCLFLLERVRESNAAMKNDLNYWGKT